MINVARMTDGDSKEGKQLLFFFTIASLSLMSLYYYNQITLSRMKIKDLKKAVATAVLSEGN